MLKNISKSRSYHPVCYISHSNHMYSITDKAFINKLSFSRTESNHVVGMTRDEEKDDEPKPLSKLILENTLVRKLKKLKDCTIIMQTNDLQKTLMQIYKLEETLQTRLKK